MKIIIIGLIVLWPLFSFGQSMRTKVNEGNELYHSAAYDQAYSKYKDALLDDPLHEIILFNEADALFKMEKYPEAREEYQKILASKDLNIAAKAHYNIGNTFFKEDKLTESIESYKKALDLIPDDFEAKYNLELARAKLKEQSEKQQQNQDQQQQQNQDQQQQQNENQDKEQQDQQQQENQNQDNEQQNQQQAEQEQQDQQQQEEQQQAQAKEDKINKDEAERLLNALKSDEQEAQKRKAPVQGTRRQADKDW